MACSPLMKNYPTVLAYVLVAVIAVLLWRIERHLAPIADLACSQLVDRGEARLVEQARVAAESRARASAALQEQAAAQQQQVAAAAAQQRERDEAARRARRELPVKPGEVVDEIYLDNHSTVRGAVVVSVQGSSVSFKAGAQLYNIPTAELPDELQARVRKMFPPAPQPVAAPKPAPAAQPAVAPVSEPETAPEPAADLPAQP